MQLANANWDGNIGIAPPHRSRTARYWVAMCRSHTPLQIDANSSLRRSLNEIGVEMGDLSAAPGRYNQASSMSVFLVLDG